MTRRTLIKNAELHRMAKVAKELGVVVEQEFEGVIFRVAPFHGAAGSALSPESNPWDAALDAPPQPVQPPFDHREQFAMELLVNLGVGGRVHSCTIRGFGPHTQKKLQDRGYIDVLPSSEHKFNDQEINLTQLGLRDWKALKRHRDKYPCL